MGVKAEKLRKQVQDIEIFLILLEKQVVRISFRKNHSQLLITNY